MSVKSKDLYLHQQFSWCVFVSNVKRGGLEGVTRFVDVSGIVECHCFCSNHFFCPVNSGEIIIFMTINLCIVIAL